MSKLPVPSIYASILIHARMNPHETAIVTNTEIITYRRFCRLIDRVSRLLQAQQLPADSRIGLIIGNPYVSWIANIALSRLGLLTCVCPSSSLDVLNPTVVIADSPMTREGVKVVLMSREWLELDGAPPLDPVRDDPIDADKPVRIVMSSGTTGLQKLVMFTALELDERLRTIAMAYAITPASRTLCMMGIPSMGGFAWPVGTWMAGGAVLLTVPGPKKPLAHLLRDKPTLLLVSTAQLEQLVQALPQDFTPQPNMVTYVAGSVLPRSLNRLARARLGQSLVMVYGSTEVGTVTIAPAAHVDMKPGLTGYVCPPAETQIVDEKGQQLAAGTTGIVRTRSIGQSHCYLDDETTTAEAFVDTWFYPGDLGALGPNGELFIQGRVRELMNFGGVKVTPNAVDEVLTQVPGVVEAAMFSVKDKTGKECAQAAVVTGPNFDEEKLKSIVKAAFPSLPPLKVVKLDKLPRNDMGKILRLELAAKYPAA